MFSTPDEGGDEEEPQGLILDTEQVQAQMGMLKSKYPTGEADYLAAARKRAQMKVESQNDGSSDADWKAAAKDKQMKFGGQVEDDWEASLKEAGNQDSQILIPVDVPDGSTEGEEPQLLL